MNRSLDEIYTSISTMLIKGIDGPFLDAVLEVELHSLAMKLSGGFLKEDGIEAHTFRFIKEDKKVLMNDLLELQSKADKQNRWNTLSYNLHPNGEYKVNFEWNKSLAEQIEQFYLEA